MIPGSLPPRRVSRRGAKALAAVALLSGTFTSAVHAANRFDPALRFRQIQTPHFIIYFHQGEDRLAHRLAVIAEETWRTLQQRFGVVPPPRTHVVLADQSEFANGYATPVPYDTVVIYTVWPPGTEFNFDDWLRLAFTHEFTHVVHLDRSEGWARIARAIFGRTSYAFPNLFLPMWAIEGIATFEESAITGNGRLHAGDFEAIVGEAARAGRPEPLDRVNGGVTDWPSGPAPYAYGADFHEYLVGRFGADSLAALATATARRFPYTSTRAFLYVYGETLGDLWRDYEADAIADAERTSRSTEDRGIRQLTHHGFTTSGPRFDRFACATCPAQILYSAANPDDFPSLNSVSLDGSVSRRLTTKYLGSTMAIGPDIIYFNQMEQRRNVGLYNDLYALSRASGGVRQVTSDARLRDPDLSPDGTVLVAAQARTGQRDLVTVRLEPDTTAAPDLAVAPSGVASGFSRTVISPLLSEPDVYFDGPRWSPDGRTIAVERHRPAAMSEVVIVDVTTRAVRVVASHARTRFVMPAWRPDGAALVIAAAAPDEVFNLFEVAVDGAACRQLTHTTGGVLWPDVSPDGATIAFAGYTVAGYDIFTMPYPHELPPAPPPSWCAPRGRLMAGDNPNASIPDESTPLQPQPYKPVMTLAPTSWAPVIASDADQVRLGAAVNGVDVLGYHTYALNATWLVSSQPRAPTPDRASPDWTVSYAYDRWRPTLFAAASSTTSFFVGPATDVGTASADTRRETTVGGGVLVPFVHTRAAHAAVLSVLRTSQEDTLPVGTTTRTLTPIRAGWQSATAHTYGYSVSREGGIFAGTTVEIVRRNLGSSGDSTTVTGDARAYLPGLAAHHVVALRLSGGRSLGDASVGRTFLLGGSQTDGGVLNFSSRASSLLRGFADATFAGSHIALVNAEYRWPLSRPQRGIGTWPILLHTLAASAFVDAGDAWTRTYRAGATKLSAGAELSSDVVLGYFARLTLTGGAAYGHDGAGIVADRATVYFRIGKAF